MPNVAAWLHAVRALELVGLVTSIPTIIVSYVCTFKSFTKNTGIPTFVLSLVTGTYDRYLMVYGFFGVKFCFASQCSRNFSCRDINFFLQKQAFLRHKMLSEYFSFPQKPIAPFKLNGWSLSFFVFC